MSDAQTEVRPMVSRMERHRRVNQGMAGVAFGLALLTLIVRASVEEPPRWMQLTAVGGWAVGPALWLFLEWWYWIRPAVDEAEDKAFTLDLLRGGQGVVRALWAAFLVLVAVVFEVYPFA